MVADLLAACAGDREFTPWREQPPGTTDVAGQRIDLRTQDAATAHSRSEGCVSCHKGAGDPHASSNMPFKISCVDCHGGDGAALVKEDAHPRPSHPARWAGADGAASAANPKQSYTLLNDENWDWIRFVNPGDLRVARTTCGGCHGSYVLNVSKSLMTTAGHFWGSAPYCNGILPNKATILGESYSPEGIGQKVNLVVDPPMTAEEMDRESVVPTLFPLPRFEVTQPGNVFRVFEKGSRLRNPLIGNPDKEEEPGRPNNRLSDRGLGTLLRIDFPVLNVTKTRLNDPHLSFLGTNEQSGDYRSSGCTACHMVYANDRSPVHSGPYARFGNRGHSANPDPTIRKDEPGHPIEHRFTTGAPSSQCMVCHMHQPNSFVNSYYGFTMWTYEADGDAPAAGGKALWPKEQKDPTHAELVESFNHNPEEAAARGNWTDVGFLSESSSVNPAARHTQFADYHGHGWMFRAAFKMDREGNLLDKDGQRVDYDDPHKFHGTVPVEDGRDPHCNASCRDARKAVHLKDIHAEKGMHCTDCHFSQDTHGNGKLYAEYQAAVEIGCKDCHGTVAAVAGLGKPTGPAVSADSRALIDLEVYWNGERMRRFERRADGVYQRSVVQPGLEWKVSQVVDSITLGNPEYNEKAAYAKTIRKGGRDWGAVEDPAALAHADTSMECYACHTSWITACFGCHLPQRGNLKIEGKHYEGDVLRNMATYNPQVARDAEFLLGVAGNVKGNKVAPVRSSSAVIISSEDAQRRLIYIQQPTISAPGYSSQAFNTHFPHTVRKTETRGCGDCHLTDAEDNNAWLAQTFLLGTNSVGLMGYMAWVGEEEGVSAVRVSEWTEPQAVLGSNLHRLAYPKNFESFVAHGRELRESHHHGGNAARSVQLRGEYLYTACGEGGFKIYDVANVANKDFSERIVSTPVSPLGQSTSVSTKYATAVALAFNNPVSMTRKYRPENHEKRPPEAEGSDVGNLHPLYRYAYISDRYEGLILVDIECLTDGDPQNNFVNERALTFNPGSILDGAENLCVAGETVYVCCKRGLVAIDISNPLQPRVVSEVGAPLLDGPTAVQVQFRYAFVTDRQGLKVLDVTWPERMGDLARSAGTLPQVPIAGARDVYLAKTYAYVAAGEAGIVIVDVTRPRAPQVFQAWNAGGELNDAHQVKVATTNDSMFAYVADGHNGLRVVQLVSPGDGQPRSPFGWSPRPHPELVATWKGDGPVLSVSKALDRDRAVDESGNQVAVFGRIGGRPFNLEEMRRFFLRGGSIYRVSPTPANPPVRTAAREAVPAAAPAERAGG